LGERDAQEAEGRGRAREELAGKKRKRGGGVAKYEIYEVEV
jgi:hypothetical protein